MLDQDDGGVRHLVQAAQQRHERLRLALGDPRGGLVEQQQSGFGQHDGGQVDHSARPGGELRDPVMAEPLDAEGLDDPVDRLALGALGLGAPRGGAAWRRSPSSDGGHPREQEHVLAR